MKIHAAGAGEKMQYLVHEFNDNTIRFILRYPGVVSADALRMAVHALVSAADVLHSSFYCGGIGAYWRVNETFEEESCFQLVMAKGDPMIEATQHALLPVKHDGQTQLCCTLVQGEGESAVVLRISHLCVDGSDGRYLLMKLAEAYELAARTGGCEGLSVKDGSRAAEQVYDGLNAHELRSLMRDPRTGVKSTFPYPSQEEGTPRMVRRRISTMEAARQRAKDSGATVNDLLLNACYHAYAAVPGVDAAAPMSIMSMMDLRRHCKTHDSAGLSNLSGSLPTVLENGICGSFEETLRLIAGQTARAKADPLAGLGGMPLLHGATKAAPMSLLIKAASRLYGSMAVGMTNLGHIDCSALAMDGLVPTEGWFGGPLKKKPGMQLSVASFDDACSLCVVGQYTQEDADILQQMLDRMAAMLEQYAAG